MGSTKEGCKIDGILKKVLVSAGTPLLLVACSFGGAELAEPSETPSPTPNPPTATPRSASTLIPSSTPRPIDRPRRTPAPTFEPVAISDLETALRDAGFYRIPISLIGDHHTYRWIRDHPFERVTTFGDILLELQIIHESSPAARADRMDQLFDAVEKALPEGLMEQLRQEHAAYNRRVNPTISGEPDQIITIADEWNTVWAKYYESGVSLGNYEAEFSVWWWQSTCPPGAEYCYYEDFPGLEFTADSSFVFQRVTLSLPEKPLEPLVGGLDVEIVSEVAIAEGDQQPFEATGAAVDAGLICASGTTYNLSFSSFAGEGVEPYRFEIVKAFLCDDLGTFYMHLDVVADYSGTHGTWQISTGLAAFRNLEGNGSIIGVPGIPGVTMTEYYSGSLR